MTFTQSTLDNFSLFRTPENMTAPMDETQTRIMIGMLMKRDNSGKTLDGIQEELTPLGELPFALKVLLGRLQSHGPQQEYNVSVVLFLACICTSPGEAVMWARSLAYETYKKGSVYTLDDICMNALPMGMPTQERISQVWDAQKNFRHAQDNWFDTVESFNFKYLDTQIA